jgi:iron complex transport system ATP-binding protein
MIELKRVCGGYDRIAKVFDVSLTIPDGTIFTLVGPNGCGKSTLLRLIGGIQPPYAGQILLDNTDLLLFERKTLAQSISYLPQSRNLPNITAESMVLHGRFPYLGYPRRYRPQDLQAAEDAMRSAGVLPLRKKSMLTLSGGERQRVYLAMVLAQDTNTVLLDEPTTYLDVRHQLEIMRFARRLRDEGKTVVMVLHDLNLALSCSDTVAVMRDGRIIDSGPPAAIQGDGVLDAVFDVRVCACIVENKTQYFIDEK